MKSHHNPTATSTPVNSITLITPATTTTTTLQCNNNNNYYYHYYYYYYYYYYYHYYYYYYCYYYYYHNSTLTLSHHLSCPSSHRRNGHEMIHHRWLPVSSWVHVVVVVHWCFKTIDFQETWVIVTKTIGSILTALPLLLLPDLGKDGSSEEMDEALAAAREEKKQKKKEKIKVRAINQ